MEFVFILQMDFPTLQIWLLQSKEWQMSKFVKLQCIKKSSALEEWGCQQLTAFHIPHNMFLHCSTKVPQQTWAQFMDQRRAGVWGKGLPQIVKNAVLHRRGHCAPNSHPAAFHIFHYGLMVLEVFHQDWRGRRAEIVREQTQRATPPPALWNCCNLKVFTWLVCDCW